MTVSLAPECYADCDDPKCPYTHPTTASARATRELREALDTIASGWTTRFPGAPDVMTATSPDHFRGEMWSWSQKVARAALSRAKAKDNQP